MSVFACGWTYIATGRINEWTIRGAVYNRLGELHSKYACKEYLNALVLMQRHCGYSPTRIPQAQDISDFLQVCKWTFQLDRILRHTHSLGDTDFLCGVVCGV